TLLLTATNVPPAPRPDSTATASRWTKPKNPPSSAGGRSGSVARCARGATSTCPLNTGRVSRNATAPAVAATSAAGADPGTVAQRWGLDWTAADVADVAAVKNAVKTNTKIIWVETPTNPLLGIADIAALAGVARDADALLTVDNTFASPYLQQPIALGADVV